MLYVALLHYPVYNKEKRVVATSLTTLDIHDIARACRTFGVKNYYIVQPIENHLWLAKKLLSFWQTDYAKNYNPNRWEALKIVKAFPYFEDAVNDIKAQEGKMPLIVSTSARKFENSVDYEFLKGLISQKPVMLCFGTGWGLTDEFIKNSDYVLKPIEGPTDYNHLSVRSAASVILDRLLGR